MLCFRLKRNSKMEQFFPLCLTLLAARSTIANKFCPQQSLGLLLVSVVAVLNRSTFFPKKIASQARYSSDEVLPSRPMKTIRQKTKPLCKRRGFVVSKLMKSRVEFFLRN